MKIKTTIGFLVVALMPGISIFVLPQAGFAQTSNQAGCQAKHEDNDADDAAEKANQSKYAKEAKITMAEAKAIALKRVPGTVLDGELEKEKGRLQYSFDICSENKQIFDVEIDAKTGAVLKAVLDDEDDEDHDGDSMSEHKKGDRDSMSEHKMDKEDADEKNEAELMKQAKITKADAEKIALKKANGKVEEGELEMENGKLVYSFDIRNKKGTITEVQVDAKTGKIVSVEEEDAAKEAAEKKQEMVEKGKKNHKN